MEEYGADLVAPVQISILYVRLSKMETSVRGTSSRASWAYVPVVFNLTFSVLFGAVAREISDFSDSFVLHKETVVSPVETVSEGSEFMCSFITITS